MMPSQNFDILSDQECGQVYDELVWCTKYEIPAMRIVGTDLMNTYGSRSPSICYVRYFPLLFRGFGRILG